MRYILHVTSRAVVGREAEYDRWYDEIHSVEMCRLPGILSCTRYRELDMTGTPTGLFVADYEVETDDPPALLESVFAAAPTMQLTDSIDMESPRFSFLKPTGPERI
ncbi:MULTISPECIES: hypothetical protein [Sphingobium]|uniref:REDY-like protein HapK n=1 Tax=Sphingobium chungbukense TaxID=56193 RepID=A0A0M3ASH7_9SPHN|nr:MULTISPECIES: hypothetical protein [Sphingobium]KKW91886.1 hypothetical protein YP76_12355 [Sphingobium chungbukense]PJG46074.1 hypothetical protein CAF53_17825 [Sphingobium sp. LB126]